MADFDIGPEEAGMMLGIAEEMAEEERALRDELASQENTQDEDHIDYSDEPAGSYRNSPSKAKQRPFERYVDEVIFGQREHGDTSGLFEKGVVWESYDFDPDTGYASIDIRNIHVQNANLVSNKFLEFISIATGIYGCGTRTIIFREDGQPVVNGRQVFGTYDAVERCIVINLKKLFGNAKQLAAFNHNHFCIHALIWHSMLIGFLHELHHSLHVKQGFSEKPGYRTDKERLADQWSEVELVKLAIRFDLERPPLKKDWYFGSRIQDLLKSPPEGVRVGWSEHQKIMLDKGLVYLNQEKQVVIKSLNDFVRIAGCATHDNEQHAQAALVLKAENKATDLFFKKEDEHRQYIQKAIDHNLLLSIDYLKSNGKVSFARVIKPNQLYSRESYVYLEAFCQLRQQKRIFRVDRIKKIETVDQETTNQDHTNNNSDQNTLNSSYTERGKESSDAKTEEQLTNRDLIREEAERIVAGYVVAVATGVALNPFPLIDIAGGAVTIVALIRSLAKTYDTLMTGDEIYKLADEVWGEGWKLMGGIILANIGGSVLKIIPFIGTISGGLLQAGTTGYFIHILGEALITYFDNGKAWNNDSVHSTLKEKMRNSNKESTTADIINQIKGNK